ncbi:MAG: hypothetical protein A3E79_14605 [Burkholderiales bacterium RIFCSPHIGHO2_12_FULL_61_11]|nr:MAG: hypothetical protein A3E79_14605 [Burkholderiales bacterium RIFCSPHIGHO2_12_FULL_61_11]
MKKLLIVGLLASASALALAKLPPPTEEAKAKAAEAAAKAAWAGKVDAYKLCKSQDKVAASYFASARAAGKETKPAAALPACADPGAFVYASPEAAKPLEASGAHSPAATATSPPGSKAPAAAIAPDKKP